MTWYLDGVPLMYQSYSENGKPDPLPSVDPEASRLDMRGAFSILDTQGPKGMELILGSGPGWPLYVDWVRVWH